MWRRTDSRWKEIPPAVQDPTLRGCGYWRRGRAEISQLPVKPQKPKDKVKPKAQGLLPTVFSQRRLSSLGSLLVQTSVSVAESKARDSIFGASPHQKLGTSSN